MSKSLIHITFFIFLLLLSPVRGDAQLLTLLKSIPLAESPASVSIDRASHIYIADKIGNVHKYQADGEWLVTYSPDRQGKIKSIESWSTLNTLLFYEGLQEYRFLNRFLVLTSSNSLDQNLFVRLMTTSTDNNLWVLDDKDYSLKKLNIIYGTPEIVSPLSNIIGTDFEGTYLKEYQNMLFLSDITSGIYVFDNLGNYIRTLPFPAVSYFNFLGNELYFLKDGFIHFYDIYSTAKRSIAVPDGKNYLFSLASENRLFLIAQNSLDIYQLEVHGK